MTAKQRALNIWESYYKNIPNMSVKDATQCAILHVKGIIEVLEESEYSSSFQRWSYFTKVLHELNQM